MFAQAVAPQTDDKDKDKDDSLLTKEEKVVELSPFEVQSTKDKGYAASSSRAGSRRNTELRDHASAWEPVGRAA